MRGRFASFNRAWPMVLVAAALLLRIAVPAGWMPERDNDGAMQITLCTGYGLVQAWVDEDGKLHRGSPDDDGKSKAPDHCPFTAAAASLALAAQPTLPEPPVQLREIPAPERLATIPGRGLAAPPPPPTGPPALA
ncbi:MAG: hypothetical protein IE933_13010 [Sphingomonadales bacterium]|nr:hypothetical protein [Sphingomonadales bacterium]MBD3773944.1 hypothetical protein [Paracoccaceae bacterium]